MSNLLRFLIAIVLIALGATISLGQDGSNIHYLKLSEIDASHVGRLVHLDFGERSFAFHEQARGNNRPLATIEINVNGTSYKFREHRVDDGYNNWFDEQYLEATQKVKGYTLRLVKSEILSVPTDSLRVRSFFVFFDSKENVVKDKSFTQELVFSKSQLSEVLVKGK